MPALHCDRKKGRVIVPVSPASVQVYGGNLARRSWTASSNRAGHRASKKKPSFVGQIAPEVVDIHAYPLGIARAADSVILFRRSFFRSYGKSATAESGAIA